MYQDYPTRSARHDIDGLLYGQGSLLTCCRHDMAVPHKSKGAEVALPPIAALFLVVFDRKVGCVMPSALDTQTTDHCRLATR